MRVYLDSDKDWTVDWSTAPEEVEAVNVYGVSGDDDYSLIATLPRPRIPTAELQQVANEVKKTWTKVRLRTWSKDDWIDLHNTLESFKRRFVRRHLGDV